MRGLQGKVAVVTGSTKAMGEAIAERLSEEGCKIVGCGRSRELGEAGVDRIRANGGEAVFRRADVTSEEDVKAVVEAAVREFGRLDVVVNNAAAIDVIRGGGESPVVDEPVEVFDNMLKVNLYGPFFFFKHAIPAMLANGGGCFVNVSSVSAQRATGGVPGYSASKGALEALSRQVAGDYGSVGIRSNTILLGAVRTPDNARLHDHPVAGPALLDFSMVPRVGQPADVAAMVAFLASDDSSFASGAIFPLEGGHSTKNAVPSMSDVYKD